MICSPGIGRSVRRSERLTRRPTEGWTRHGLPARTSPSRTIGIQLERNTPSKKFLRSTGSSTTRQEPRHSQNKIFVAEVSLVILSKRQEEKGRSPRDGAVIFFFSMFLLQTYEAILPSPARSSKCAHGEFCQTPALILLQAAHRFGNQHASSQRHHRISLFRGTRRSPRRSDRAHRVVQVLRKRQMGESGGQSVRVANRRVDGSGGGVALPSCSTLSRRDGREGPLGYRYFCRRVSNREHRQ